jgi:hypothetical protein
MIHDQMIKRISNSEEVYLHYNFFGDQPWNLIITEDIVDEIITHIP